MGKIADIYKERGDLDKALHIYQNERLSIAERLGDIQGKAITLVKIADIYQDRGDLDEALRIRLEEELPVYEQLGDVRSLLEGRKNLALLCLQFTPPRRKEANHLLCLALTDARRMNIPEAETIQNILHQNNMTCDP